MNPIVNKNYMPPAVSELKASPAAHSSDIGVRQGSSPQTLDARERVVPQ